MNDYRQPQGVSFSPDEVPFMQPGQRALIVEEFLRGGATPAPNRPNGQQWIGPAPFGLAGYIGWDISATTLFQAWIDTVKQGGCIDIRSDAGVLNSTLFAGVARAAPVVPGGVFPFKYALSGKISVAPYGPYQEVSATTAINLSLFLSFAALPADGAFASVGLQIDPNGFKASAIQWTDHATQAAPPVLFAAPAQYFRFRVLVNAINSCTVLPECSLDGVGWQQLATFTFASVPRFLGFGGYATGDGGFLQGASGLVHYMRAFDITSAPFTSRVTDGGPRQL